MTPDPDTRVSLNDAIERWFLWLLLTAVNIDVIFQTIKTNLTRDNDFVRDSMMSLTNQFKRYENYSNVMMSIKKEISSLSLQLLQKDASESRTQVPRNTSYDIVVALLVVPVVLAVRLAVHHKQGCWTQVFLISDMSLHSRCLHRGALRRPL